MADLTHEILTNRDDYPDDQEITLANGSKITVKQMRDALMPKADYSRETEKWSQKERQFQTELQQRQSQVDAMQAQLAEAMKTKEPATGTPRGQFSEEELENDPVVGPILKRTKDAQARLEAAEARMAAHEKYVMTREYQGRLSQLERKYNDRFNKDGKKPFDMPKFLEYVQRAPILAYNPQTQTQDADLETMYDKFVRNDEIAEIERMAEERGLERGKKAAQVPNIPFGRRRPTVREKYLPESGDLRDLSDEQIMNDPEIQEAMLKDMEG